MLAQQTYQVRGTPLRARGEVIPQKRLSFADPLCPSYPLMGSSLCMGQLVKEAQTHTNKLLVLTLVIYINKRFIVQQRSCMEEVHVYHVFCSHARCLLPIVALEGLY